MTDERRIETPEDEEEIIKALEHESVPTEYNCVHGRYIEACGIYCTKKKQNAQNCHECREHTIAPYGRRARATLDLINRQKAEVDELKLRNERQRYVIHTYHINEIRKAAVKEFVEAYKEEIVRRYEDIAYCDLFFNVLDDLANKVDE